MENVKELSPFFGH